MHNTNHSCIYYVLHNLSNKKPWYDYKNLLSSVPLAHIHVVSFMSFLYKVCVPKTNTNLKPTLCTTCIHLEAPIVCMWYIVLVLGQYWFGYTYLKVGTP